MIGESLFLYRVLSPDDYRRMPWKNGLGETLEIALKSDHNGVAYRISQAAVVSDGAFSDFSGMQRTLVLLKGRGMKLTHHTDRGYAVVHELYSPLAVARFAGSARTEAELVDGAIDDLNIMVREGQVSSYVETVCAPASFVAYQREHALFSCFYANSHCELRVQSTSPEESAEPERVHVASQHTVQFANGAKVSVVEGSGVFIDIFAYREPSNGRYFTYAY